MTINPESVKAYARELLEAEERGRREGRSQIEQELSDVKAGYRLLDRNWNAVHRAATTPIREALGLPDGTIVELLDRIEKLKRACKLSLDVLPGLEVRSWPPGHKMKANAIAALKAVVERQGEAMEVADVGNRGSGG